MTPAAEAPGAAQVTATSTDAAPGGSASHRTAGRAAPDERPCHRGPARLNCRHRFLPVAAGARATPPVTAFSRRVQRPALAGVVDPAAPGCRLGTGPRLRRHAVGCRSACRSGKAIRRDRREEPQAVDHVAVVRTPRTDIRRPCINLTAADDRVARPLGRDNRLGCPCRFASSGRRAPQQVDRP